MKLYISGPMTGVKYFNKPAFNAAEKELRQAGFDVFNPASVELLDGTWLDYMRIDIKALMDCDGIALLPNWEKSKGAQIEVNLARDLGMRTRGVSKILHQEMMTK